MANETLSALTAGAAPNGTELMYVVQGGNSRRLTALEIANAADAWATAAQGALADSAVQPGDLATVATTGAYGDLSGTPTLGTMATQNAASVSITGGSITGITDLAVADGGTGASTAADARANLGLVIGTDVQAFEAKLQSLSGLTGAADRLPYLSGASTFALATFTAFGRSLVDDADAATARTTLGLGDAALATVVASVTDVTAGRLLTTGAGPAQAFRRGNVVGTVTQTAGTPTGAVIERGNNANGEYVRFADGTQICGTTIQGLASGPFTRTWPASFAANPRTAATITAGVVSATVTVSNITTTSIDVYTFNAAGAQTTAFAQIIAFGRWF